MGSLKTNKPSSFDGKHDEFAVRTWIYQVKQYLILVQVGSELNLDDPTKISFAATFLSDTAAAWWYTRVGSNTVPNTWNEFENALLQELFPLMVCKDQATSYEDLCKELLFQHFCQNFETLF